MRCSSGGRPLRRAAAAASCAALPTLAAANPFLGGSADASAPIVRAPSGSGPAFLTSLQLAFRDQAAEFLSAFKDDPRPGTVAAVLAVAFLYGILHAAGPGHRKTVVFSLFVSRKAAPWEPLAAGFLSALTHAAAGIAVVLGLGLLRGIVVPLGEANRAGAYIEAGTFMALVALAAILALRKGIGMLRGRRREHGDGGRAGAFGLYGIVAVTSIVPCPGAVVMLLFALYLDLAVLGAAGVLAMSVGMGLVVSGAGYLAYFGRAGLFARLKGREGTVALVSDLMELGSYLIVLAFSLFMAWPSIAGML